MSAVTLAEYALLTICVAVVFEFAGTTVKIALEAVAGEPLKIPTPMVGIGAVVIGGWYWYGPMGGIRPMVQLMVLLGVLSRLVSVVRHRKVVRALIRDQWLPGAVAVGVAVLMAFSLGSILGDTPPTVVSGGNNDIASYALLGQHVAERGPSDPGSIVGFDAGARIQSHFDTGAILVTAASGSLGPFDQVWRFQFPLMIFMVGLLAYTVAGLLLYLEGERRLLAVVGGVSAISPILFSYLWSQYFLNQIMAMGLLLATSLLIARGASRPAWRSRLAHALAASILLSAVAASYPHIGLLGVALVLPSLVLAGGRQYLLRRIGLATTLGAVGAAGAAILMPTSFSRIAQATRSLATIEAGWDLPGFLPAEVLGFTASMSGAASGVLDWLPSLVLLGVVLTSSIVLIVSNRSQNLGLFSVIILLAVLGSYAAVYSYSGVSYQQWKWITSFVPIVVGTASMTVLLAVNIVLSRLVRSDMAHRISVTIGFAYIVLMVSNSGAVTFPTGTGTPRATLSPDFFALEDPDLLSGVHEVTIDLGPYWETMWAAYFLRSVDRVVLRQPSYYPVASDLTEWRLQATTGELSTEFLEARPVGQTMILVRQAT